MLALRPGPEQPAQFVFDRGHLGGPAGLLAFVVSVSEQDRAKLEDQVVRQAQDQLGLKTLRPLQTRGGKTRNLCLYPGLRRPGNRVLSGLLGRRRLHGRPLPSHAGRRHPQRPVTQRSKSQACATENDPLGGQILALSQAVQPTRATLIRVKNRRSGYRTGPSTGKGTDALSVTICYRTIRSVLMRFFAYPAVSSLRTVSAVSLPAASAALWAKPRWACEKALPQTSLHSPRPLTVRMHPMKKFWMHWRVTGALAAVLVACGAYWWLARATARANDLCGDTAELRATHIARTLAAQMEH